MIRVQKSVYDADKNVQHKGHRVHKGIWVAFAIAIAVTALPHAQAPASSKTRAHVTALASERFEGRLVGSNGEKLASDYLVSQLRRIGAKPLPGATDFLLPFEFTAGTRDGGSAATITDARSNANRTFNARTDVQALSFSDN